MDTANRDTRSKLLDAAALEFARFGLRGARTKRIADTAGVNESLLFRHFGGKEALFEQVYEELVTGVIQDVPFDAIDLPGYAAALFDHYQQHPDLLRLSVWAALERPDERVAGSIQAATDVKIRAIKQAQQAGLITQEFPPGELLALVTQLTLSGTSVTPELGVATSPGTRRESIARAVAALTTGGISRGTQHR